MRVERIPGSYEAVQWTGDNFAEVEEVVQKYIPENSGPYRDDEGYDPANFQYDTLTWWCCDDHELDREQWVVFHTESRSLDGPDYYHEIMSDEQFREEFRARD